MRTENANKPHGFGMIDANDFSPFPKNPAISKFFREIGLADELGSGIRNINKYLKVYSGGKPEFHEEDIFTLIVPIKKNMGNKDFQTHQDVCERLVEFCKIPRTRNEMMEFLGLKDRINFKKNYLSHMLEQELIKMTIPDKPTSKNQKYVTV